MNARSELSQVLQAARTLLALPDNDFSWSSWENTQAAVGEMDRLIAAVDSGDIPPRLEVAVLFAPTGPIQEVSLSSGWANAFLVVAERFDVVADRLWT